MKPLLSIIVPVYNTEKYIEKTIKSILSQKLQNFELILVDDGSPDNCGVICDMYAKIDSRIKVIHKENGGLSSARNAGLDEAEGDYIGFVDSDDYLEPFMYKKLVDAIILGNGDISFCRLKRITKDCEYFFHKRLKIEEVISGEELLRLIFLSKIDASSCTKIFKKDFFRARRFQVGITNEDFELFYKSLATVKKVIYVEDTYYAYQERENSITTGTKFKKDLFNNICNMKKYIYNNEKNLINESETYYFLELYNIYCMQIKNREDFNKVRKELIENIINIIFNKNIFKIKRIKIFFFVCFPYFKRSN